MLDRTANPLEVRHWRGSMPVSHRYTAGEAGEAFFRALRDRGVFLAARCEECGISYCPARIFCERCLGALGEPFEAGPGGTLHSFTVVYRGLDDRPLDRPVVVGLVRLEGADTLLVHRIGGDDRAVLEIGMRVEPVLRPARSRSGSLDDVEHFRPVAGA